MWSIWFLSAAHAGPVLETGASALGDSYGEEGVAWSDTNGRNRLVWTKSELLCEGGEACGRSQLWIAHETTLAGHRYLLNELVVDNECLDDGGLDLLQPVISDVDEDGIAEITFGVRAGCITDLSPLSLEVHLWEGSDTGLLYGQTPAWEQLVAPAAPTMGATLMERPEHRLRLLEVYQAYSHEEVQRRGDALSPIGFVGAIGELDLARRIELRDLVGARRPAMLEQSASITTRTLMRASGRTHAEARLYGGRVERTTRCRAQTCDEGFTVDGGPIIQGSTVLGSGVEGNSRVVVLPDEPGALVSGYVGYTSSVRGAAHSRNELTCFTADPASGAPLSIEDLAPEAAILATIEARRQASVDAGLDDPLRGYELDPRSFRVVQEGRTRRTVLCAVSNSGSILEIPVLVEVAETGSP